MLSVITLRFFQRKKYTTNKERGKQGRVGGWVGGWVGGVV